MRFHRVPQVDPLLTFIAVGFVAVGLHTRLQCLTCDQFHFGLSEPYSVPVSFTVADRPHLRDPSLASRVYFFDLEFAQFDPSQTDASVRTWPAED
jgi:hypothetical protein